MEEDRIPDPEELTDIRDPCFEIGTRVRWSWVARDDASAHPTDRGVVRGMRYVWNKDLQNWQYQYYIALEPDSPSYEWTKFDWGWQEDLEAVFFSDSQTIEYTEEKTSDDQ